MPNRSKRKKGLKLSLNVPAGWSGRWSVGTQEAGQFRTKEEVMRALYGEPIRLTIRDVDAQPPEQPVVLEYQMGRMRGARIIATDYAEMEAKMAALHEELQQYQRQAMVNQRPVWYPVRPLGGT